MSLLQFADLQDSLWGNSPRLSRNVLKGQGQEGVTSQNGNVFTIFLQ